MSSHRILLIDDEPDILTVLSMTLQSLGDYEIKTCDSGGAALAVAPTFRPETIFLDVMMPDMDGLETLTALRNQAETATVPVVIMTAKTGATDNRQYRLAGAATVLSKPFRKEDLRHTMLLLAQPSASALARDPAQGQTEETRLAQLNARYSERLPAKISEIQSAWREVQESHRPAEAANALRTLAHKLAGTAASYGYGKLGTAAAALERELDEFGRPGRGVSGDMRSNAKGLVDRLATAAQHRDD